MVEESNDITRQRKTISPYDITTLGNLGFLIMQVQLKGKNYDEWLRSLRTVLREGGRNLALLMGQPRSRWITQRILKIGGPLIPY